MNRLRPLLASALGLALAACTNGAAGAPILANPVPPAPSIPARTAPPVAIADPLPVVLPRDDGPHDRLTEWWYYTGHLRAEGGARYGFEFVVFRAERGSFPTSWVSHLAITDETGSRFLYSQRLSVGTQVDRSPTGADGRPVGFDLSLAGADPSRPESFGRPAWTMSGGGGIDHLSATLAPDEAVSAGSPGGLGLDLRLAATKPASLHDRDGWIDFGPAGGSYYYSRTAMQALGTLTVDGHAMTVDGAAWFDHQWGDFISVGGGGWDWFAVNLDDGTDLTLSLVRDADRTYGPSSPATASSAIWSGTRSASRSPVGGSAPRRARTIPLAGRSRSRLTTCRSLCDRPWPTRNSTRAGPPGSSTGKAPRSCERRGPESQWGARATSS